MGLVGPGRVDPEQLALRHRDQIIALVTLLGRQLVVGEPCASAIAFFRRSTSLLIPAAERSAICPSYSCRPWPTAKAGIRLEARFDEIVDEGWPVAALRGGASIAVIRRIATPAAADGQRQRHCRRDQIWTHFSLLREGALRRARPRMRQGGFRQTASELACYAALMTGLSLAPIGILLLVACLIAMLSRRLGLPYIVGLVVAGFWNCAAAQRSDAAAVARADLQRPASAAGVRSRAPARMAPLPRRAAADPRVGVRRRRHRRGGGRRAACIGWSAGAGSARHCSAF